MYSVIGVFFFFIYILFYFYVYPAVSDHGSSQISQLLIPILYIVLFILCYNINCLVGEILRKKFLRFIEENHYLFFRCEFDTRWGAYYEKKINYN